jgi:hypothetical protein
MPNAKHGLAGAWPWVLAISVVAATQALGQTGANAPSRADDMRLWSFGDCERKYPRADTGERKECMRIVGSAEARDLRAQRVCEDSYGNDQAEIDRCTSAYRVSRERPAQGGSVSNATATAAPPLSPEMMRKVKAIASAAVEQNGTAAAEAAPADPATSHEGSSTISLVLTGALAIVLLGIGATVIIRNQA